MLRRAEASTSQIWPKLFGDTMEDEVPPIRSTEDGLECPVCWEEFNNSVNLPYVLWCGHTLCKNCVMALEWAVVKLPIIPVQLPLFIACPWCQLLSCRFVWKGKLRYPCKNFFLLWMVESATGNQLENCQEAAIAEHKTSKSSMTVSHESAFQYQGSRHHPLHRHDRQSSLPACVSGQEQGPNDLFRRRWLRCLTAVGIQLASKLALFLLLLLIVFCALPLASFILFLYFVITVVFAFPAFLVIYFAFPSLSWLLREIVT